MTTTAVVVVVPCYAGRKPERLLETFPGVYGRVMETSGKGGKGGERRKRASERIRAETVSKRYTR